jgi:hypothetical protein
LASSDPLAQKQRSVRIERYQLRIPEIGEAYEYHDSNTGAALLPCWEGFERDSLPHPAPNTGWKDDAGQTCKFLG